MSKSEIVQKISEGYTVKEIAAESGVNVNTLRRDILNLRDSCNCKSIAHLVANFFRRGLIH